VCFRPRDRLDKPGSGLHRPVPRPRQLPGRPFQPHATPKTCASRRTVLAGPSPCSVPPVLAEHCRKIRYNSRSIKAAIMPDAGDRDHRWSAALAGFWNSIGSRRVDRGGRRPRGTPPASCAVIRNPTCATCRGDGPRRRRPMGVDAGPRHSPSAALPRVEGPVLAHGASLEGSGASLPRRPWPSRGPCAPSSAGNRDRARGTPRSSGGAAVGNGESRDLAPSDSRPRPADRRGPRGTAAGWFSSCAVGRGGPA
jgi:hypothetical protein